MSTNILDTNTQRCYYPETGTYKQEVCSPYNQLPNILKMENGYIKRNIWIELLYILLLQPP